MNRDVIVKVKGIQGSLNADEAIEMITVGQYFERNGKTYIKYEDRSLYEDQVTATTIKIAEDQVSILRHGAANTQMIFEKDREHYTPYETPFGLFELIVRTKDIQVIRDDEGLSLQVDYTIDINHSGGELSQFHLEVRNADQ